MRARRAKPSDLDAVLKIEGQHATTAHWTRRQFEEELSSEASVFLVIEKEEEILGFAVARRYPPNLELLDIAVAMQRKGVGRELISALKDQAQGCERITLEVSSRN